MKSSKGKMKTYLQGNVTQKQKEQFQAHMDYLGFESTSNPGEFAYDGVSFHNLVTAGTDVLNRSSQLPMHSHTFMEIFQYISDSRVEYLIETQRYILQQGDIVCVPPGICHQVLHYEPEDTPCIRNLICFQPSFLEAIGWKNQPGEYYLLRTSDKMRQYMEHLCRMAVQECEKQEPRWRDAVNGYGQILLANIVRSENASIAAEQAGLFEEMLTYVDNHLSEKITLIDTAQHFFISDRTVTREFRQKLGISFYRYVTQRRLLRAQNLIFHEIPLTEVCQRCGFTDYPTFYRAFKKEYGISPRQMKQTESL